MLGWLWAVGTNRYGALTSADVLHFTLVDAASFAIAVASQALLLGLPGAALASLSGVTGFREAGAGERPLLAVVTGLALLPALDSLTTRFAGLDAALALNLALALAAIILALRGRWSLRLSRGALALLALWFGILCLEWVDIDTGNGLYQSFTAVDMVKHAATSQAILDTGAPPHDPFFARPGSVSYYYFFYTLTALSQRLCDGLIDARAAVAGLAFWTGIGIYGLARILVTRCGLIAPDACRRIRPVLMILLAAGGIDIVFVLRLGLLQDNWLPDPTWWTDDVANWFEEAIWVPHHLTALIAALTGFIIVAPAVDRAAPDGRPVRVILTAALCFVSALGCSVWLSLAAVTTAALWFSLVVFEKRWRAAVILALTGLAAVVIASPAIADLIAGRSPAASPPIELAIRAFSPADAMAQAGPLRSAARFIALPFNYFAEFGILFSGSVMFWSTRARRDVHRHELARVLTLGAIAGLLLGSFLRSTLFDNNDLGWRVLMVPQMAGLVWTAAAFAGLWQARPDLGFARAWRLVPALPLLVLALGLGTTLYAMGSLRAHIIMPLHDESRLFVPHPAADRALREAYDWANIHLPPALVLQHNPDFGKRVVNFGLYSHASVGVSDLYGSLYGASPAAVEARIKAVMPLFTGDSPHAGAVARGQGIGALVVSAKDPVWSMPGSWVWRAKAIYENAFVRIIPVPALDETDTAAR